MTPTRPEGPELSTKPSTVPTETASKAKHHRKMSEVSQGPGLLEMVAGDDPEDPDQLHLGVKSSSVIKFYPDWCKCWECCIRKHDDVDVDIKSTFKDFFSCPPRGTLGRILVFTLLAIFFWGVLFYLLRPLSETSAEAGKPPHPKAKLNPAWVEGPIFALFIVEISGLISGVLLKRYLNFPPLLGPLILGIIFNNVEALNVFNLMKGFQYRECRRGNKLCEEMAKHTINSWVKPIRMIALAIILTRAGLELSPKQLTKLKGTVPLLAFGPCVIEACCCALCNYLFFNLGADKEENRMSLAMCFVGGFALAAVSPAVVVPGALSLKRKGLGVARGIPTLLIAASSIDDVLAISAYTVSLGSAVKDEEQDAWKSYAGGVIGILIGLIHGIVFGIALHFLPSKNSKSKPLHRIMLLLLINILSVLAYEETWYNSAGSISVLTTSFIAGFGWRSQPHWKRPMHKIEAWLAHMWVLWVPLIFGTIGKEINFSDSSFQGSQLAKTFGVIFISLTFRCLTAFTVVSFGTGFNVKERIFIALSWIPKATVQAALAPLVLTRVAESTDLSAKFNATIVVNVAILAVLITAPAGCILMQLTGPIFLDVKELPEEIIEEEFPDGEGMDPAESTYGLVQATARLSLRPTVVYEVVPAKVSSNLSVGGGDPPQKAISKTVT